MHPEKRSVGIDIVRAVVIMGKLQQQKRYRREAKPTASVSANGIFAAGSYLPGSLPEAACSVPRSTVRDAAGNVYVVLLSPVMVDVAGGLSGSA